MFKQIIFNLASKKWKENLKQKCIKKEYYKTKSLCTYNTYIYFISLYVHKHDTSLNQGI